MFEKLSIRPQRPHDPAAPLDLGALVEGLLFYGRTEVVLNSGSIKQIAEFWSPEGLLALLDSGMATFKYQQNIAAIQTQHTGTNRERYAPVLVEIASSPSLAAGPELLVGRVLDQVVGKRGRARRLTAQVCRRMVIHRSDEGLTSRVTADLLDVGFADQAVRRILKAYTPELSLPVDARFEVQQVDEGLRVLTNIDFPAVNALYHKRVPPTHSSITPAFLLAHFVSAREMVEDAAHSDADMAADPAHSAVAELRIKNFLSRRDSSQDSIATFQAFLFDDGRGIREAVNAGDVTLSEILALLNKAEKFKTWLRDQAPDADLVKEYFRVVTSSTWVDRLPSKTLRWLLFSGVGLGLDVVGAGGVGTAIGLTLGAVDSLVLDSMLRGWKPNHFVETSLSRLLTK